jgi:hypothetical protein
VLGLVLVEELESVLGLSLGFQLGLGLLLDLRLG